MTELAAPASALQGLRVVDLSPDLVGAYVSQTLADFGADVIWVEPPGGSRLRRQASFPFVGRGKRSVVVDLRTRDGVERARRFAAGADVLIETFRPGVAERLGLGYDVLATSNPRLVYASITGFGRRGPWSGLKGYEGVVAAVLGLFSAFAGMSDGRHPTFVTVPWCSFAASHAALQGILAALIEREDSGHGQWVETSLAQAVTIHEGASSAWYLHLAAQLGLAQDDRDPVISFPGRLLVAQTKDGHWVQFAQNRPRLFEAFLRVLGLGWMLDDPRWEGIPAFADEERRSDLLHRLVAGVKERTLAEWEAVFATDRDVFAEVFRSGAEVLDHPQLVHDRLVVEVDDPERGRVRQPAPLVRMSATPGAVRGPAPVLGGQACDPWEPSVPARSSPPAGRCPLAGVTVLELAIQYAAPYGVTLLADLGARVIKIEPLTGDTIRAQQAPRYPEVGGGKPMQGKSSVAVDIHTREGLEIVHQLARRVDLVVNGFRAGVAERGGFDAATLRRLNPDLLYLSASGYGDGPPFGDRPAFATSFAAASGISAAQLGGLGGGEPAGSVEDILQRAAPLRAAGACRYASADGNAALGLATAALLGLLARRRGAGGQELLSSMIHTNAHAMAGHIIDFPGGPGGLRPGPDRRGPSARYRIYDASDGCVFLAAPQEEEWEALVEALVPHLDLRGDERFVTAEARRVRDHELAEALAAVFVQRRADEWQRELSGRDVACVVVTVGPVEALLLHDDYGRASGYLADVTHPIFGHHARLAPIVRFSRCATNAAAGELCGASTDAVLRELGYRDGDIADLRARRVVA